MFSIIKNYSVLFFSVIELHKYWECTHSIVRHAFGEIGEEDDGNLIYLKLLMFHGVKNSTEIQRFY